MSSWASKINERKTHPMVIQLKSIKNYIKHSHRQTLSGILATFSLCLFTLLTVFPIVGVEQKTEAATGTASTTSLTLTTTGGASLDLAVDSNNGTFATTDPTSSNYSSTSTQAEFTVTTTNYTGYTLSISNSDSDTNLTASDTTSGSSTIASIGSATGSSAVPSTGISATTFNTTAYNGMWGYKPSMLNSSPNSNYLPSPTTTATTLNITNCANGRSNGSNTCPDAVDTYTIDLAARLEYTQDSGSYTNTFILTAVGNPIDYTVNYNGTGADSGTTPGAAEDETNLTYITLSSVTPTKDGYTFKGWCTVDTGTDGTNACTGTTYQPGDQYPINQTTQNVATLYAMWEADAVNMQDLDPALCTSVEALTVKDRRDGKTYTVQRLADGKCWMTSNLNLAGGTALYSDDSNVADANTKASGNPYYTLPASSTNGFSDDTTAYVYNSGNETTNQSDCTSSSPCNSYYSWLAATAGGKDSSGNAVTGNGYDTVYSICPKGWKLPSSGNYNDSSATSATGYKKGDFYQLSIQYGMSSNNYYQNTSNFYNQAGPGTTPNFLLAGYYSLGSFSNGGSNGSYWSSASRSSYSAYSLSFGSNDVYSANYTSRSCGYSVRCVLDDSMQTITATSLASKMPNNGDSTTLTDVRDGKTYQVTKINGAYWMTENLRYLGDTGSTPVSTSSDGTMVVKSITSNYNSDVTKTLKDLVNGSNSSSDCYGYANGVFDAYTGGGWTNLCVHEGTDNNGNPTVWYNYSAATVGTIATTNANTTTATYSICPREWRLPTNSEQSGITSYITAFNPIYGGQYVNGSLNNTLTSGMWWSSSTADGGHGRYSLSYNSDNLSTSSGSRYLGYYVRCIRTT